VTEPGRMDWPRLYRVRLADLINEHHSDFTVLSWLGPHKAVAMAVEVHLQRKRWPIYAVEVEDLGPAPRQADGIVGEGPRGYLEDRSEF
jgi:hypothetical protein